jgi:hypothetical protein
MRCIYDVSVQSTTTFLAKPGKARVALHDTVYHLQYSVQVDIPSFQFGPCVSIHTQLIKKDQDGRRTFSLFLQDISRNKRSL